MMNFLHGIEVVTMWQCIEKNLSLLLEGKQIKKQPIYKKVSNVLYKTWGYIHKEYLQKLHKSHYTAGNKYWFKIC